MGKRCGWEGCKAELTNPDEQFLCSIHQGHPQVIRFEKKTGLTIKNVLDDGGNSIGFIAEEEEHKVVEEE